jgi:hypothetical protein
MGREENDMEDWQLTREQFIAAMHARESAQPPKRKRKPSALYLGAERANKESRIWLGLLHRHIIARAIKQGLPVPANVRAEYPSQ